MELLVLNRDGHMDAWDQRKVDSLSPELKAKYDRRHRKWDVVEVREDGFWDHGFDKEAFILVKVPGENLDPSKADSLRDKDHNIIRRRKWNIDTTKVPSVELGKIESTAKTATLTSLGLAICIVQKIDPEDIVDEKP